MKPHDTPPKPSFHAAGAAVLFLLAFSFTGGASFYSASAGGDWAVALFTLPLASMAAAIVAAWAYAMIWVDAEEPQSQRRKVPVEAGNPSLARVSTSMSLAKSVA